MPETVDARFDRLLAKLDPKLKIARLEEELSGKEGQPGLSQRFIDQLADVGTQTSVAKRLMDNLQTMSTSDPAYERARTEAHTATYVAVNFTIVLETIADELERVLGQLEEYKSK